MASVHAHYSPWAGTWYPGDVSELEHLLSAALQGAVTKMGSYVRPGGRAFLVPHAAPSWSGGVAASAYRHVKESGAARVIILGFSHRQVVHGIAVPDLDRIGTPLGAIQVDRTAADALSSSQPFHSVPGNLVCDHSCEIQLPFLQTLLPGAAVLPLYVGRLTPAQRQAAAKALRERLDTRTVLIASSDLTHYGRDFDYLPFEAGASTPGLLSALDMGVLTAAGSLDAALFRQNLSETGATVCGAEPIQLLLETLAGLDVETFQEILDYDTSGAIGGDYRHSVSYGAAGYFPAAAWELASPDQAALLEGARRALDHFRHKRDRQLPEPLAAPALQQRGRAFVTLFERGSVRGCVGCFETPQVLAECVPQLAVDACGDPRFGPIQDWDALEIEVHLLTPPKRIADPRQFRIGEHGAFLKAGGHKGLLLPAVARRHQLSHDEFLKALARKAGVPDSVYSGSNWELAVFRDQSFKEGEQAA